MSIGFTFRTKIKPLANGIPHVLPLKSHGTELQSLRKSKMGCHNISQSLLTVFWPEPKAYVLIPSTPKSSNPKLSGRRREETHKHLVDTKPWVHNLRLGDLAQRLQLVQVAIRAVDHPSFTTVVSWELRVFLDPYLRHMVLVFV